MRLTTEAVIEAVTTARAAELLAQLTRPSSSYRARARLAVLGLIGFLVLYLGLAAWFVWLAWKLVNGGHVGFWGGLLAVCALFLGVFMLKALFSVRSAKDESLVEIRPADQPRLFAFLHGLADAVGAPRPHKVFLSNEVNAAVFYDLSLLNLFFPSRKNLVIGLPLVNALSLGEFRAVLAHEFGHFAQRSMAVGRWVYTAQQIAGHLVWRRDKLEDLLDQIARIDLRVRAVVVCVQIAIWAIRSVIDTAFRGVIVM